MGNEQRLKKEDQEDGGDQAADTKLEESAQKEDEEESDEMVDPEIEECFEYKLVGVTVHSGSANAGHYWSYINTQKDKEAEGADTKDFAENDAERWMEFNDSIVKDFSISKLKDECYGGDSGGSGGFGLSALDGWGFNTGGGYGKSGYMLFYEKKVKKPLKILKQAATEDKPEETFEIPYTDCLTDDDMPNQIFTKVLKENQQLSFENDVYSENFFDFLLDLNRSVVSLSDSTSLELKKSAFKIGIKTTFQVLARAYHNAKLGQHMQVLA